MASSMIRESARRPVALGVLLGLVGGLLAAGARARATDEIPGNPRELTFEGLVFEVPRAEPLRHEVAGVPVYIVEDRALPLVDVSIQLRIGSFLDPVDKVGVASLAGALMRRGGAGALSARDFDRQADQLAADLGTSIGGTQGRAAMNCLTSVLDACLDLLFDMMKAPRFEAERLALEKENLLEQLEQRNDQPPSIANREWQWLLYGDEHFSSRLITGETLEAITREDLVALHRDYWRPENMVIAVSGDVDTQAMLAKLAARFADWPAGGKTVPWPPPKPTFVPEPGLYVYDKDIPQGRVHIGHLGLERTDWESQENAALAVANDILGGGGFTSRLVKRIRSDEGLAYSAGSAFVIGTYWPGTFEMQFQSKSETVAFAAKIALEEMARLRREPVSEEELRTAQASFIDTFPGNFDSSNTTVNLFASDELLGRPHSYWYGYRERLRAVDQKQILDVAQKYLHPDHLVFLIVGDWDAISQRADERASIDDLEAGAAQLLPERDPVSLVPRTAGGVPPTSEGPN
jgi:predicted Zn-dependent peptidase